MAKSTRDAPKKSGAGAKSPKRKRTQPDLVRLNRALRMISDCNQTLVRAHDESALVADICRVIVERGGYLMAWVGYAEHDKKKSVPAVASAGRDDGYVDSLQITWADSERGRGPTGSAIRTGKPSTSRDMQTDPNFGPWRGEAAKRGFRSSIVLPLKTNSHVFGALSIYSGEADAFDEDEERLLIELADDLAYGITALREREARAHADELVRQANEALVAERQRFADVLNVIPAYVVLLSPDYHVPFANRFFEERFGKSNGQRCYEYLFGRSEPCEVCDTYNVLKDGQSHRWDWVGPDGRDYSIFDFPFTDTDGAKLILEMGIDVTERKRAEEAVRTLNAELEKRVEERTAELLATNEKLHAEVAERRQVEEALRQSDETLASLALFPSENPNPVLRIGRDGRLLYGNPASEGFLAALGARGDRDVSPVLHRAALSALSAGAVTEFEFTDDQNRTYWLSCAPVPERDYANIYVRNITERVLAEAALRESEQRYRSLFETMSEGFCLSEIIYDEQGKARDMRCLAVNPGFERQTGLKAEDIVGHTLLEIFPDAEPTWMERFGRVALTGESAQFEERFGPLGRWFDIRAFQSEPGRFAVMFMDVTERMSAEEALKESEKRERERAADLRAVLDAVPAAVWIAHDPESKRISGNHASDVLLRVSPETNVSKSAAKGERPEHYRVLKDGRELRPVDLPVQIAARGETIKDFEFDLLFDDGTERHLLGDAIPVFNAEGAVRGSVAVFVDITERKKAEEELRRSQEQFRSLADAIPQLAWFADADGYIRWYNRRWYEYTGTTPEQMEGWGWQSVHDPEALPSVLERWKESIATGNPFEMIFPLRGADGLFRLYLTRVEPLKDASGKVVQWFGTNTDVDELKRAEDQLRKTSERLQMTLAASRAGTWDWDLRTQKLIWSPDLYRMFGLDPETAAATMETWDSVMFPEDRAKAYERLEAAIRDHRVLDNEYRVVWPNGDVRWIYALGKAVYDERDQPVSMSGLCIDCTERKILEQKLEESERLYRGIGEALDYGIWVCDPNGRNIYASESYLKLVGITQQQCSDFGWGDTLHPDDAERTIAAWKECARTGGTWDIEHRFRGVDGKWHPILARGVPIRNEQGEITAWAGINLDISGLKRTEEALQISSRRFEILANTSGELLRTDHPHASIETLCRDVMEHLDCQVFFNFLADPIRGRLHLNAYAGVSEEDGLALEWLDYGQAICGRVAQRGRRIIAQHIPTTYEPGVETVRNIGVKAYCCHPLLGAEGQVLGTLSFGTRTRETFTEDEVAMMKAVCDNVAVAMTRIKAQETIAESEERFHTLFSEMQSGAAVHEIICDEHGRPVDYRFLDINPAFERQTGLKRDAVVGRKLSEILPDSEPFWVETYGKVALTGEPVRFENIHESLGKHYDCIAYRPSPGQFAVIFNDVTDRKRAEAALRETKDLLENLINHANAPIIVWNPQHEITLFNHAFERLTGRTADEVIGAKLDFLFPELTREHSLDHIRRALAGEKWEVEEIPIVHRDGSVRTVLWNSATIFGEDGGVPMATIAQGQDITERKRAEEALRGTRDFLQNLIDYANAPIIVWSPDYEITLFNHAFERLTGRTADEVIGAKLDILFPVESRRHSLDHIRRAVAGERWETVEIPILHRDGSVRTVLWNSATLYAQPGDAPMATVAQGQDITDRKRAEVALRESEQRWATTLSSIGDAVIATDELGQITFMNAVAEDLTGWTRAEAAARPVEDVFKLIDGASRAPTETPVTAALRQGMIVGLTNHTILIRKDGSEVMIDDSGAPIRNADGLVTGVVVVFRDITERKHTEEAILRAKQEWERTFDSVPDLIAILDDSHRMLRANRAMAQSLSLTPGQCIGKFCYQAVHGMSCPHESCPHTLTIRDGRMHTAEVHEARLGGDFLVTTTPLTDENGKRIGSVHVARDITERKQLEEEIRRHNEELAELVQERTQQIAVLERQRMEGEKQASLGRMAARIAHEINNPLAAIKNAFRIVRKTIPPESPDLNFLSLIDSEMTRIERIVRQTFELYKPNPSESASVAPMSVVEDVVQLMRGGLQAREVNIVLEEPKEPFKVSIHPDSLKQLLYGILQNAVEASSPKTTVRVSIDRQDSSFTLAIADQGCGIPEDIRQKLFDPFFTTKAGLETGGLGLGLSIARSLLDAMGGTISFESTVGKGTTFFITLPLTAPEVPAGGKS